MQQIKFYLLQILEGDHHFIHLLIAQMIHTGNTTLTVGAKWFLSELNIQSCKHHLLLKTQLIFYLIRRKMHSTQAKVMLFKQQSDHFIPLNSPSAHFQPASLQGPTRPYSICSSSPQPPSPTFSEPLHWLYSSADVLLAHFIQMSPSH